MDELVHSIPVDFWSLRTRVFTAICGATVHRDDARRTIQAPITCPRCQTREDQDLASIEALKADD